MVSKITILEPHFDGAQFGPASLGSEHPTDVTEAEAEADSGTGSRSRWLLGAGALSVVFVLGAVVRRARKNRRSVDESSSDGSMDDSTDVDRFAGDRDERTTESLAR